VVVIAFRAMLARRICAGALVLSVMVSWAPGAAALSDEERSAARAAATQGAYSFDAGKWAVAVELFSRAEALVHSPAHLLYIARAQVKLGHWVKASENLNKIKREPLPPNAPPAAKRAVDEASKELAQLEPQLPYVAAKVKNPSGEVQITMDGTKLPPLLIGLMRPVDPGEHQFQASNGELTSDVVTLDVKPASRQTVELELKPAATAAPVAAPVAAVAVPSDQPANAVDAGTTSAPGSGTDVKKIAGFAAIGVGAVGLGVGTFFLIKAAGTQSDADELCPGDTCPASLETEVVAKDEDAASQRTVGVVGLALGGVAVAAGITLLLLPSNKSEAARRRPSVQPYFGFRSVGLSGQF
jgi:uncharacterized membrane protein